MAQQTALSPLGIPGPPYSFVAKIAAVAMGVTERRRVLTDGTLLIEFVWVADSTTGKAERKLQTALEGNLVQFESSYLYDAGTSPGVYNVYLYDELRADWLDGRGTAIDPTAGAVIRALYEAHGSDRVERTAMMGRPTLYVDASGGSHDRGTVRLFLRHDSDS